MNNELKKIREMSKKTQKEVSRKANISERYFQRIEAGSSNPTVDIAIRIADALCVDVKDIF